MVNKKANSKKNFSFIFPHHHGNQIGIVIVPYDIDKLSPISSVAVELLLYDSIVVLI